MSPPNLQLHSSCLSVTRSRYSLDVVQVCSSRCVKPSSVIHEHMSMSFFETWTVSILSSTDSKPSGNTMCIPVQSKALPEQRSCQSDYMSSRSLTGLDLTGLAVSCPDTIESTRKPDQTTHTHIHA